MSNFFFTPHSRSRFQERYGFRPSIKELSDIAYACTGGRAALMRTSDEGGNTFCWKIRALHVFPVVSPEGVIITFLPPDFFVASSAKSHRREMLDAAGKPPKRRDLSITYLTTKREPYKRDRTPAAKLVGEE